MQKDKESNIARETALWFSEHRYWVSRSNDILIDAKMSQFPKGNKSWEIELVFQSSAHDGKPYSGYFACHDSKRLTTYSVTLKNREYWFDQIDRALGFLELHREN